MHLYMCLYVCPRDTNLHGMRMCISLHQHHVSDLDLWRALDRIIHTKKRPCVCVCVYVYVYKYTKIIRSMNAFSILYMRLVYSICVYIFSI